MVECDDAGSMLDLRVDHKVGEVVDRADRDPRVVECVQDVTERVRCDPCCDERIELVAVLATLVGSLES